MGKLLAISGPLVMGVAVSLSLPAALAETVNEAAEFQGFDALEVLENQAMADFSGRDSQTNLTNVQSIQELEASVSSSSFNADTIMSGAITIEQHALDNFKGVGMFNIFTGNNNAVSSAVGISVYLTE